MCVEGHDSEANMKKLLAELKGKENWEKLMIARRRKTMAVCGSCHQKIHHGTF